MSTTSTPTDKKFMLNHECGSSFFSVASLQRHGHEGRLLQDNYCYTVVFMEKGSCECQTSDQVLILDPSSVAIIKPKQAYTLALSQSGCGYVLSFTFEFMQAALNSAGMAQEFHLNSTAGQIAIPDEDRGFLQDIVCRLRSEFQTTNGLKDAILRGLFQIFALYLNRITAERQPSIQNRCLYHANRFFALLDEHFATLKMPADYANLLAVSPSYLNFIIKENFGLNTSYYIQQRVLTEAKKLMSSHEITMKEVAYKLGFFDVSHFSKFFKRNTGMPFTDFRRAIAA
ncbi:helix-turn-helix domain-containing protein [Mucilaginibacter rubeus]|uniref:helix-turn-helix domain-containing protein n=1 Tax=Mucilaginibacter rubeus TaxID=2027860 RepID=UPI0016666E42|nr:helix-turn-helix domain-containing protein [Mucilaginibacter rubeus]GGA96159.1 transcriptional regulator [Mucilaginibacter rubeus]